MSKVLLNYDQSTGQLSKDDGLFVASYIGLTPYDGSLDKPKIDDLVKLKEAGFTAEEIVMMVKKEVL